MPETTAEKVHNIFMDCLFKVEEIEDGKIPEGAILVDGIVESFGFHPERLNSHRDEVKAILDLMPSNFHKKGGGGWSLLNLCQDKDGNQWAEHPTMQELVVLGKGLGMVAYCMPREMWAVLPGGVPYIVIDTEGTADGRSNG
jgi:hypothetical protein